MQSVHEGRSIRSVCERRPRSVLPAGENIRVFYERRIVGEAFGVAGDIDIALFPPTLEQVQNFNQEAGEMEREKTQRERRVFRLR